MVPHFPAIGSVIVPPVPPMLPMPPMPSTILMSAVNLSHPSVNSVILVSISLIKNMAQVFIWYWLWHPRSLYATACLLNVPNTHREKRRINNLFNIQLSITRNTSRSILSLPSFNIIISLWLTWIKEQIFPTCPCIASSSYLVIHFLQINKKQIWISQIGTGPIPA